MATFVWAAAIAGNWSLGANWQVGGVAQAAPPTAADDVLFGSGTNFTQSNCTIDADSTARSVDCTGYTGTITHTNTFTLSVGDGSGGALKFVVGMIYTASGSASGISFVSTSNNGGAGWNVTTGGKTLGRVTFSGVGGRWSLQDAVTCSSTFTFNSGTLDTNGVTIQATTFTLATNNAKTLNASTSTITMTATTTSTVLSLAGTVTTINAGSATFVINGNAANTRTVALNSKTIGRLSRTGATGAGQIAFTQSGTITTLNLTNVGGSAYTVRLTVAVVLSVTTWDVNGTSSNLITLDTTAAGSAASVSAASGTIVSNYLSIKDSTATGGATWWAENSTNVSGNTGWNFGALRTITDSFTLADSRSQVTSSARTVTDAFGLLDSRTQVLNSTRTVTDAFGLLDSRTQATAYARSVTDAFGLLDSIARAVAAARTVTDAFGLVDVATRVVDAARSITDGFGLADSRSQVLDSGRTITDAFTLADSVTREVAYARTITDGFGLVDSTIRELAAARTITDTFGITDSVARTVAYVRAVTDAFALADSIDHALAAARTITDAFGLVDSMTREAIAERTITDAFGLLDDVSFVHHVPPHLLRGTVRALDRAATVAAGTRAKVAPARTATRQAGQGPRITDR